MDTDTIKQLLFENNKLKTRLAVLQEDDCSNHNSFVREIDEIKKAHKKEVSQLKESNNILIDELRNMRSLVENAQQLKRASMHQMSSKQSVQTQTEETETVSTLTNPTTAVQETSTATQSKRTVATSERVSISHKEMQTTEEIREQQTLKKKKKRNDIAQKKPALLNGAKELELQGRTHTNLATPKISTEHPPLKLATTNAKKTDFKPSTSTQTNVHQTEYETSTNDEGPLDEVRKRRKLKKRKLMSTENKYPMIYVTGSSNARDIAPLLNNKLGDKFNITGTCMPNATIDQIINTSAKSIAKLNENDTVVIFAGFNDITQKGEKANIEKLAEIPNCKAKIIIAELRYTCKNNYNPQFNVAIHETNKNLKNMAEKYPQKLKVLKTSDLGRSLSTDGFHLKKKGKLILTERLCSLMGFPSVISDPSNNGIPIPVINATQQNFQRQFQKKAKYREYYSPQKSVPRIQNQPPPPLESMDLTMWMWY